jgi:hypothetical protein
VCTEKRKKTAQDVVDTNVNVGWKKKSIFFTLPYWKDNLLQHNLNVMHIEKKMSWTIYLAYSLTL